MHVQSEPMSDFMHQLIYSSLEKKNERRLASDTASKIWQRELTVYPLSQQPGFGSRFGIELMVLKVPSSGLTTLKGVPSGKSEKDLFCVEGTETS